ncbi:hypothetical protein L211DRAFT_845958 [Terfezia boudieri ATCC MYA-4762]|uniref:Uncharacterized protein n=1 Tax=Terfezia boudieri ATCC MYA-4762 TaxID=1051890 RepID=A0A3N4LYL5_9PEZI|nr:hypothetical protein L211DRAFT_845958 [Terfezia boudieri ATCC MYA-4762]
MAHCQTLLYNIVNTLRAAARHTALSLHLEFYNLTNNIVRIPVTAEHTIYLSYNNLGLRSSRTLEPRARADSSPKIYGKSKARASLENDEPARAYPLGPGLSQLVPRPTSAIVILKIPIFGKHIPEEAGLPKYIHYVFSGRPLFLTKPGHPAKHIASRTVQKKYKFKAR